MSSVRDVELLVKLLKESISATWILKWGYCYPFDLAVWRFIEKTRPGILGPLNSEYDEEPVFYGNGARWFTETLGSDPDYSADIEKFMYWLIGKIPDSAKRRGFLRDAEIPPLDLELLDRVVEVVLRRADEAKTQGQV